MMTMMKWKSFHFDQKQKYLTQKLLLLKMMMKMLMLMLMLRMKKIPREKLREKDQIQEDHQRVNSRWIVTLHW